ncbi:MAG TPA: hypothetical protein VGN72_02655 [Tepidisphaeraceae bacterium]|nr:hypothetical protein [Tepidisphaeraceae bacterium]
MPNLLFICSRNRLRSPTAEAVFGAIDGIETQSAGLAADAECIVSADMLAWADVIFVMEPAHGRKLSRRFGPHLRGKRVVCLHVRDVYTYMDPRLIDLLWTIVPRSVPALRGAKPQ